ncbi:MAG: hypothetical protein ICV78_27320 [Tolypothrix sp. Co-bin9]|nr:hypothetical protein [Tolypothrix sp. Co-bin9]
MLIKFTTANLSSATLTSQFPSNNVPTPTEATQLPSSTQLQIDRLTPQQAVQNYFEAYLSK